MYERNKMKQLYGFCDKAIKIIYLAIGTMLLFLSLTNLLFVSQDKTVPMEYTVPPIKYYILFVLMVIVLTALKDILDKIPERVLFAVCTAIYIAAALYLILNINSNLRSDQRDVYDAAININHGILFNLEKGGELFRYPNNLGITTFYRLLTKIRQSTRLIFLVNLLFALTTNWLLYRFADLIFDGNGTVNRYTILFAFMSVPHFFFIVFAYGNIPGFTCVIAMVYAVAKIIREPDLKRGPAIVYGLAVAVCAAAAVLFKSNYMIAIVAVAIVLFMQFLQNRKIVNIILIAVVALSAVVPQKVLVNYYEDMVGIDIEGTPEILWVAMGLQGDEYPGWYNGFNSDTYGSTDFDREASAQIGEAALIERIEYFRENPEYAKGFFLRKIVSTWCEPTYQSVHIGPRGTEGRQNIDHPVFKNLYTGGSLHRIVYAVCWSVAVCIYAFSLIGQIGLITRKNSNNAVLFPLLFLIGGFLFHLMWETKSQYVYTYCLCIVPFAAKGMADFSGYISGKIKSSK